MALLANTDACHHQPLILVPFGAGTPYDGSLRATFFTGAATMFSEPAGCPRFIGDGDEFKPPAGDPPGKILHVSCGGFRSGCSASDDKLTPSRVVADTGSGFGRGAPYGLIDHE